MGRSYRQLALLHGVSPALAWRVAGDVYMHFLSPWHRARLHEDEPPPPLLGAIHALLARRD